MADPIRDLAEQEPEQIRLQIDETRSAITEKLEALEDQVIDTVQTVKETVQETIETTRETVQETISTVKETFDLRLQVVRHPWPMLGGSLVAGFLTGALIGGARHQGRLPMDRLRSDGEPLLGERAERTSIDRSDSPARRQGPGLLAGFQDEIAQVKGLAIGMLFGLVRDTMQENLPQMSEAVGDVMDRITTKLGGQPVKGPVLQRAAVNRGANGPRADSARP